MSITFVFLTKVVNYHLNILILLLLNLWISFILIYGVLHLLITIVLVFLDDYTIFNWLFPLKPNSDVESIFMHFQACVEHRLNIFLWEYTQSCVQDLLIAVRRQVWVANIRSSSDTLIKLRVPIFFQTLEQSLRCQYSFKLIHKFYTHIQAELRVP